MSGKKQSLGRRQQQVSASGKVDGKMGRWPPYQGTGRREEVASTGGRHRELQMLFWGRKQKTRGERKVTGVIHTCL